MIECSPGSSPGRMLGEGENKKIWWFFCGMESEDFEEAQLKDEEQTKLPWFGERALWCLTSCGRCKKCERCWKVREGIQFA